MNASNIKQWPDTFSKTEWPKGVLPKMHADVLDMVFELREVSGIPMWPSALYAAHVRDSGTSAHSTSRNGLSDATDMHCETYTQLLLLMVIAIELPDVGGVGIYFNTNTPMLHLDRLSIRGNKLTWLVTKDGEYIYKENDPSKFYQLLNKSIVTAGSEGTPI